jgi:hypothetical protein
LREQRIWSVTETLKSSEGCERTKCEEETERLTGGEAREENRRKEKRRMEEGKEMKGR